MKTAAGLRFAGETFTEKHHGNGVLTARALYQHVRNASNHREGEGNLEGVAAPELESSGGWQIYKPTSEFQPDPEDHNTARGAKIFTYTLIPVAMRLMITVV